MKHSLISALLVSVVLGVVGCSKEEPEGTAEKMGKQIDKAAETIQKEVADAGEATREQAAEAKAELGAALEEKAKQMQGDSGK